MTANVTQTRSLAIPLVLLLAVPIVVGLTVFAFNDQDDFPKALEAHGENQIPGYGAAHRAIIEIRDAVENRRDTDFGILAGPPTQILARFEESGSASTWTVVVRGPVRSRPNTEEEFNLDSGEIVVEISAFTGEIAGNFSAGRASTSAGGGVIGGLGLSHDGFVEVPLKSVWPPKEDWIRL